MPRYEGHAQVLRALRKLLRDLKDSKLDYLTLFTFSIDNWKRPKEETSKLMQLLRKFISNDLSELHNNNVRIRVIGSRSEIDFIKKYFLFIKLLIKFHKTNY